jgi:hypothetical protein
VSASNRSRNRPSTPEVSIQCHTITSSASSGIGLSALSPLHLTADSQRGLLLRYGRLPEPSIPAAVAALSKILLTTNT